MARSSILGAQLLALCLAAASNAPAHIVAIPLQATRTNAEHDNKVVTADVLLSTTDARQNVDQILLAQMTGMLQHVMLGKRLRQRYIDDLRLISSHYVSNEVYVRSTDFNRTLSSAISNMVGFYAAGARAGLDFPDSDDWPRQFVPVAIHTVHCPRYEKLLKLRDETPEYRQMIAERGEQIGKLHDACGVKAMNESGSEYMWGLSGIWAICDTARVEIVHNRTLPSWLTPELLAQAIEICRQITRWDSGMDLNAHNGVDFRRELATLSGGTLLSAIADNMRAKVDSSRTTFSPQKYFAFSLHDVTMVGLYTALGFHNLSVIRDESPDYAQCIGIELWRRGADIGDEKTASSVDAKEPAAALDTRQIGSEFYVRLMLWLNEREPMREITHYVEGCQQHPDGCPLTTFIAQAQLHKPLPSFEELCSRIEDLPEPVGDGSGGDQDKDRYKHYAKETSRRRARTPTTQNTMQTTNKT